MITSLRILAILLVRLSIILMLILFPATVYAQTSYYRVPSGKIGFGLGVQDIESYHQYYDGDIIQELKSTVVGTLNVSFGFNNGKSKISAIGGISSEQTRGSSAENLSDSSIYVGGDKSAFYKDFYVGGIEAYHLYPLDDAGFEIYSRVDFIAWFHREAERIFFSVGPGGENVVVPEDDLDIPTMFRGTIGLSKDFNSGNVGLRPSLGLGYSRHNVLVLPDITEVLSTLLVEAGLELKIYSFSIHLSLTFGEKRAAGRSQQTTLRIGYIPR